MEPSGAGQLDERREPADETVVTDAEFDEAMEAVLGEHAATLRKLTT